VSVGTTGSVSISVDDEVRRIGAVKKQAVVEGALEVLKDALHGREMGLMGVVHVEAHLLDRVGNCHVGPPVPAAQEGRSNSEATLKESNSWARSSPGIKGIESHSVRKFIKLLVSFLISRDLACGVSRPVLYKQERSK
jgi:hypothetical protein